MNQDVFLSKSLLKFEIYLLPGIELAQVFWKRSYFLIYVRNSEANSNGCSEWILKEKRERGCYLLHLIQEYCEYYVFDLSSNTNEGTSSSI
jgi:hypothetical protein